MQDLASVAIQTDQHHLTTQQQLAKSWSELMPDFPADKIHVCPSIEHAVRIIRSLEQESRGANVDVLVCGSLHLVGGVIEVAGLTERALASGG